MKTAPHNRRRAVLEFAAVFVAVSICAGILFRFPPESYSFYPSCPIHESLHFECPGCGTTRALAALLHGRLREAVRLNPLTVLGVLPSAVAYAVLSLRQALRPGIFRWPSMPPAAVYATLAIAAAFTIARNLPHISQL